MTITKARELDLIEVLPLTGHLQVRFADVISEDGIELSRGFHRIALDPGADVSKAPLLVRQIASLIWTPQILAAHKARIEELKRQYAPAPDQVPPSPAVH